MFVLLCRLPPAVKSIEDLSTIFKELAVLVIDQGTILDRIDFNMEQVRSVCLSQLFAMLRCVFGVFRCCCCCCCCRCFC